MMVCVYLGRRLDELLFFLTGSDHRYDTQGLLFISLSITNQQSLRVPAAVCS